MIPIFSKLKKDLPASLVVFFVALPLCLGIALASGAPLFSGIIAGIIGGIIVGALSGSNIGVSGPAAGLAAIVLTSIGELGGFENFLVAVVLAGIIQILLGILKAGIIGYYFPSSVIKGMLTGIGIIIILKQIPHFFGYDADPEGDFSFLQRDGETTFTELGNIADYIIPGSAVIGISALILIYFWDNFLSKKHSFFSIIQGPLVAVVIGIIFYELTSSSNGLSIADSHLVNVPVPTGVESFLGQFKFPNFEVVGQSEIWLIAFTIALVASLETLLCVEATDKLDPDKNVTPTNRELLAQGTGNIISGLIGGLPITQVIVRSSANIQSGGKTKLAAIVHGILLLISVIAIPTLLNKIPLSVLAAILLVVGFKLAKPSLFKKMYLLGWQQFVPFIITVLGIVFTDLLIGISLGLAVGILVVLFNNFRNSHFLHMTSEDDENHTLKMTLAEEVTFINKGAILNQLDAVPNNSYLEIDVRRTQYLDFDIIEILEDFGYKAKNKNIHIKLLSERGTIENPESFISFFRDNPKQFSYLK
jgi:MFS superfamily sulfate permease-like transporter